MTQADADQLFSVGSGNSEPSAPDVIEGETFKPFRYGPPGQERQPGGRRKEDAQYVEAA